MNDDTNAARVEHDAADLRSALHLLRHGATHPSIGPTVLTPRECAALLADRATSDRWRSLAASMYEAAIYENDPTEVPGHEDAHNALVERNRAADVARATTPPA